MAGPDSPAGMNRRQLLALGAAGLLAPRLGLAAAGEAEPVGGRFAAADFTLRNATLVLPGGALGRGGVRVEGGKIAALGEAVTSGEDLGGAWLCPGFTDAGCTVGMFEIGLEQGTHDEDESSDAVTPDARAWEGYNPLSEVVPVTRVAGITALLLQPEANHLITGQAGLVRSAGRTLEEALIRAPIGLCVNLGGAGEAHPSGPKSRMGVAMKLRELLDATKLPEDEDKEEDDEKKGRRRRDKAQDDKDDKDEPPDDKDASPRDRALRDWKRGKLLTLVKAERADDILAAVALLRDHKLKGALVGCAEGHLVARELAASGLGVLLGPLMVQPDSFETLHARYDNARRLDEAGVKLAFRSGANHFSRGLRVDAGVTVAHGLRWETAITALTSGAGGLLGLGEGYGQLAVGAPATFFEATGDPLQARQSVRRVWIDGALTSRQTRQSKLAERYRVLR